MKKLLRFIVPVICFSAIGCLFYCLAHRTGYFGAYIEQEVRGVRYQSLCPSGNCMVTSVWKSGEIIDAKYDDAVALSDSLIKARKEWAGALAATLNNVK